MSERFVWQELKKLVVLDHDIQKLKAMIKNGLEKIAAEQKKLPELKQRELTLLAMLKESQKKTDSLELDCKQLKSAEQLKKRALDTSANPKEYSALEKELAGLELALEQITESQLLLLDAKEYQEKELRAVRASIQAEEQRIQALIATQQSEAASLTEQVLALEEQWNAQQKLVPVELADSYIKIRSKVHNPVVPVVSESCSACFYPLPPQDMLSLTSKTVIRCRSCYRFLFSSEATLPTA